MNQFVLILQDNPETGELDIAGVQKPDQFDGKSPAHIVGQFLQNNIESVIEVARSEAALGKRLVSSAPEAPVQLVLPLNQKAL
jgi:hypothetical protein